jgi:hypothetical protein
VRRDGAPRQHEHAVGRFGRAVPVIESLVGRFDADGELMSINGYVLRRLAAQESRRADAAVAEDEAPAAWPAASRTINVLMVINGLSETKQPI